MNEASQFNFGIKSEHWGEAGLRASFSDSVNSGVVVGKKGDMGERGDIGENSVDSYLNRQAYKVGEDL